MAQFKDVKEGSFIRINGNELGIKKGPRSFYSWYGMVNKRTKNCEVIVLTLPEAQNYIISQLKQSP